MSKIMDSADCVYCRKVKSGYWRMAEGWLCKECYGKIYWGIHSYNKWGEKSRYATEINKRLTAKELEDCFNCLKKGEELRRESTPTVSSQDGSLLIDGDKGLIYVGENVYSPTDEKYTAPAHPVENIAGYYLLYHSEIISPTDNAIKSAYLMIEFKDQPLRYERIPLGKPKGFFNFNRRRNYRKRVREYFDIMQTLTGKGPDRERTVIYKP